MAIIALNVLVLPLLTWGLPIWGGLPCGALMYSSQDTLGSTGGGSELLLWDCNQATKGYVTVTTQCTDVCRLSILTSCHCVLIVLWGGFYLFNSIPILFCSKNWPASLIYLFYDIIIFYAIFWHAFSVIKTVQLS